MKLLENIQWIETIFGITTRKVLYSRASLIFFFFLDSRHKCLLCRLPMTVKIIDARVRVSLSSRLDHREIRKGKPQIHIYFFFLITFKCLSSSCDDLLVKRKKNHSLYQFERKCICIFV